MSRNRYRFTIQQPGGNGNPKGGHWTPMSHPTPTIACGSWCAGCAPTLVALCATMHVPARMVQIIDHAMAEVLVGGQWCLADNSTNMWNGENEMFSRASLAEILLGIKSHLSPTVPYQTRGEHERNLAKYLFAWGLARGDSKSYNC